MIAKAAFSSPVHSNFILNHSLTFLLRSAPNGLSSFQKGESNMFSKSSIMPLSLATLALSGLIFQFINYVLHTPVTLLHP
jgi:hypothetical protein